MANQGLFVIGPLYSSSITIDHTQVPSTQNDFPVLVNVTDNRFKTVANGGHVQNANGFDIRPAFDPRKTFPLTYELDFYSATTGQVVMWVRLPNICPTANNVFYLTYGDSTISTDGSSAQTWCNNYLCVFHFGNGTSLSITDSSPAGMGLSQSANPVTATAGQIDGAAAFVSASSEFLGGSGNPVWPAAITWSAWINATSFPNAYNGVVGYNSGPNTAYALMMVKSTGKLAMYTNLVNYDGTGTNTLSSGTTYYLVMTYNNAQGLVGYVNGAKDGTGAAAGSLGATKSIAIGDDNGNAGRFWNGWLDEVRGSSIARSPDWITCEYNNQKPSSTFITLGGETGP